MGLLLLVVVVLLLLVVVFRWEGRERQQSWGGNVRVRMEKCKGKRESWVE
jgi:hypothetical protein